MNEKGFTLLEVLTAIAIMSIAVSTVFISYNSLFSKTGDMDNMIADYEAARTCLRRITQDLESVYIRNVPEYVKPDFDSKPDPYRIIGKKVYISGDYFCFLRFSSYEHIVFDDKGISGTARIIYYAQKSKDSGYVVKRSDTVDCLSRFEEDDEFSDYVINKASDPVLCERVKLLEFKFFDKQGNEYEEWNSESEDYKFSTPAAVGIRLEIEGDSGQRVFETRVCLPIVREF